MFRWIFYLVVCTQWRIRRFQTPWMGMVCLQKKGEYHKHTTYKQNNITNSRWEKKSKKKSITIIKIDHFLAVKKVRWREWQLWLGKNVGEDGGPPKNIEWLMLHVRESESRRSTWHSVNCENFCPQYHPTRNCRKSKY